MRPVWCFLGIIGLALALRLALALTYPHFWGVDGGASGVTVNYWMGLVDWQAGFPKPPLAPGWLLAPFWLLLGPDTGYKVWSALFSVLPLVPVYLLTRKYVGEWPGVFAAGFAAIDLTWGEMFVSGAHPLGAFALLGLAFWAMGELAERFSRRNAVILALSVGLIPWVNQTTAGLALILLPVYWLALVWLTQSKSQVNIPRLIPRIFARTIPSLFIGGIIALGALPWYLQTLPGSSILTYQGPTLFWAFDWPVFQALFISWPLGAFAIWKAPDARVKALGAVLLVLGLMVQFMSFDEVIINPLYRARYFTALVFYPLITWVVWKYWLPRFRTKKRLPEPKSKTTVPVEKIREAVRKAVNRQTLAWGLGIAACIYMSVAFVYTVRLQNEYSLMVTQDTARALELLRATDPKANVATNSFTLSLWVSALNKVHSPFAFTAPPPPAYVQADRDLRCLYNWVEGCDPGKAAQQLNVGYLLIEERFPFYNNRVPGNYLAPPDQWAVMARAPWLELVYSEGTTRLWSIDPDTTPTAGPSARRTPHQN